MGAQRKITIPQQRWSRPSLSQPAWKPGALSSGFVAEETASAAFALIIPARAIFELAVDYRSKGGVELFVGRDQIVDDGIHVFSPDLTI